MEEENNYGAFPFTTTTLALGGCGSSSTSNNNVCCMPEEAYHSHYFNFAAAAASNDTTPHRASTTLPSWLCCQRTPQIYVQFLSENGPPHVQNETLPFSNSAAGSSGFTISEASFDTVGYKRSHTEGVHSSNLSVLGYQIPSQNSNESYGPAATGSPSTVPSSLSRQKASTADRRRRLRISEAVEALQELLPHSREGGKASVLDDIVDHIKYLQFQVKELSQSRLGGESSSTPFILLEGYGHFLLHDQMQNEPLEEMMGKLLEVNPLAATQLLESRGLIVMPMSLAEGFCPQN